MDERQLRRIERDNPQGLSSSQLLSFLEQSGIAFSEATLRKYVQLGLLPRSVRVGEKGKHRGSRGLYPPKTLSQILFIKRLLSEDWTIEEIKRDALFLTSDLDELEQRVASVIRQLNEAIRERTQTRHILEREVQDADALGRELLGRLAKVRERLLLGQAGRGEAVGPAGSFEGVFEAVAG